MNGINQYLRLIPSGLIYIVLCWMLIPQLSGKWTKIITIILLIPVAYFLAGYVDAYLPNFLYGIKRWFNNAF